MRRTRTKGAEPGAAMMVAEVMLGIALGAVCAAAWLAARPVAVVTVAPKPSDEAPARHATIYIAGRETPVRQSQWQAKRRAFAEADGGGVELVEQDANRWVAVEFGSLDLTRKWESFGVTYKGALPRFRFDGATVELGATPELSLFGGSARKLVVQAVGRFEKDGAVFAFSPSAMKVGALPIPTALLRNLILGLFTSGLRPSEDFAAAWTAVDDVKVEEGRMKLGFKRAAPVLVAEEISEAASDAAVATESIAGTEETLAGVPSEATVQAEETAASAGEGASEPEGEEAPSEAPAVATEGNALPPPPAEEVSTPADAVADDSSAAVVPTEETPVPPVASEESLAVDDPLSTQPVPAESATTEAAPTEPAP